MSTAGGKLRAWAFYKGHPLPPPGSFQEKLVSNLMARERNEKMAFARLLVMASVVGRGISAEIVSDLLEEYREELSQDRYNLGYESIAQRRAKQRIQEVMDRNRMMARLDSMTVTDEETKALTNAEQ